MRFDRTTALRGLVAAVLVALVASACGDDDSSGSTDETVVEAGEDGASTTNAETTASERAASETSAAMAEDEMSDAEMDPEEMAEGAGEHDHDSDGGIVDVPAEGAPSVSFTAEQAGPTSAELTITTTGFEIVDDGDDPSGSEPYAGHVHVVVDGSVASMVYRSEVEVALTPGENEVRVELADHDHRLLVVDGEPISYALMIHIPETPADEFHTHEVEGHEH